MKMPFTWKSAWKFSLRLTLMAVLMSFLAGCETVEDYSLTCRVWDNSRWQQWSGPAANPNLALFAATNRADLLVRYDALSERRSATKTQAYYLRLNETRIAAKRKPNFVQLSTADGLQAVPLLAAPAAVTNLLSDQGMYAVTSNESGVFTLHQTGAVNEIFSLPVYVESSHTPARVLLTPFAVVGDTVMVGVVGAGVAAYLWLVSGAPGVNHY